MASGAPTIASELANVPPSAYTVGEVMSRDVEWVDADDSVLLAAQKMESRNVGILPVAGKASAGQTGPQQAGIRNAVIGMLTDRDIVVRVVAPDRNPRTTRVGDVMSPSVHYCYADDNLALAERLMIQQGVRRLPVFDRTTNELAGILSVDDIALLASRRRAGEIVRGTTAPAAAGPPQPTAPQIDTEKRGAEIWQKQQEPLGSGTASGSQVGGGATARFG